VARRSSRRGKCGASDCGGAVARSAQLKGGVTPVGTHAKTVRARFPALLMIAAWSLTATLAPLVDPGAAMATAESDVRCLALTLYWEARDEGRQGMLAVGWVVLNRRDHPKFSSTICRIVRAGGQTPPCQFSYWCDGRRDEPGDGESWTAARALAAELLSAPPPDPTHGAILFHRDDVKPAWSTEHRRTARVGRHIYYR
jgi:spore germination cell wall hydrolase CwlJ-like protein